jgi:NADPH:quinone reductase-like Zn-dependent oxidoreductase
MYDAKAYSAASTTSPLAPTTIARRDPTEHDVQIEILFCGICHSDLHSVRNEWSEFMPTVYPIVPGHEIVGRVTKAGSAVTSSNRVTSSGSVAWLTLTALAPSVRLVLSSFVRTWLSLSTHPTSNSEALPTVDTPKASSSTNASF